MSLSGLLSALDNLAPYATLRESLQRGASARLALIDAAKPYLIAGLQRGLRRTIFVVVPQAGRARELVEQIQAFSTRPEAVALLPEHDSLFYERLLGEGASIQQRVGALSMLESEEAAIVVGSVRALMPLVVPPRELARVCRAVRVGETVRPGDLAARWQSLGYRSAPLVDEPGVFSQRGGILDVFPVGWPSPVRIEFFGDEVESLRLFDLATQRSQGQIEAALVLPAHEVLPSPGLDPRLAGLDDAELREESRGRWRRDVERLAEGQSFEGVELYSAYLGGQSALEHLAERGLLVLDEPAQLRAAAESLAAQAEELRGELIERGDLPSGFERPYLSWEQLGPALEARRGLELSWREESSDELGALAEAFRPLEPYGGRLKAALDDAAAAGAAGQAAVVVTRQARRLEELLREREAPVSVVSDVAGPPPPGLVLVQGSLAEGFALDGSFRILTDREVFGWSKVSRAPRQRSAPRLDFLSDLEVGGYVVHVEHGVARYLGMEKMSPDGVERDYLLLEYAAGDRLYVPFDQADRVGRYVGAGDALPSLSRLGTTDWVRAKARVKAAVQKMAEELLDLYAAREIKPGHSFGPDTVWQSEMEAAFPYVETPDQLEAIEEIKADMEKAKPMDRLLCGDVGYGKTEVAIRAAFKAVMDGKQVAVLVPTTVLAQQHYSTFKERLDAFPVNVAMLSRFRSEKEQDKTIADLKAGSVDICIGTHRLIQKDVEFKDLGLIIIDEEQRFGVVHKERLKQLRKEVDVLTLSATPIPRTLHMALVGVRDMSTMDTPPEDRLPIKTYVAEYDEALIREALLRELDRGGQVYFVHNRVQTIHQMANRLSELVPEASIAVGHGQMPEEALERVMVDFSAGKHDVLVCSTIIESGLDIPNVNTMIVNRADLFGLAQLYQLRGRVGRGANRAYAYFIYPKGRQLSEIAETRLRTIFEATELGSGFRIAMKDLEIRGAGNLLGPEQHGQVAAVGFHLYCQLLAEAVKRLKGEPVKTAPKVAVDLPVTAYLSQEYVADEATRLNLYQRLAGVADLDGLGALTLELRDRFGPPPEETLSLLYVVQLKLLAAKVGVESLAADERDIIIQLGPRGRYDRLALERRFGDKIQFRPIQVRLARQPRGVFWQDLLQQVLEAMAGDGEKPQMDTDAHRLAKRR